MNNIAGESNPLLNDLIKPKMTLAEKSEAGKRMQIRGLVMKHVMGAMASEADVEKNLNVSKQDRRFLLSHMPLVEKYLHYRMVDVSSIKMLVQDWYKGKKNKPNGTSDHTAMSDIRNSIAELKHYRANVFVEPEEK